MEDNKLEVKDVMQKLQVANQTMEELIDLAMEDKRITEDEMEILYSINKNLETYARAIMQTIEDNQISRQEILKLKTVENKIIEDATNIASEDQLISSEEKKLLEKLITSIKTITK